MALLPGCYPRHPAVQLLCRPTGEVDAHQNSNSGESCPQPQTHIFFRDAQYAKFSPSLLFLWPEDLSVLLPRNSFWGTSVFYFLLKVCVKKLWRCQVDTFDTSHCQVDTWWLQFGQREATSRVKCKLEPWDLKYDKTLSLFFGQSSS